MQWSAPLRRPNPSSSKEYVGTQEAGRRTSFSGGSASSSTHTGAADDTGASAGPSARNDFADLEKADTNHSLSRTTSSRVNRVEALTRRRKQEEFFTHPLSHVKTSQEYIVDFDGPDDPYKPLNWPFRKKVMTTMIYGLTTMGATFASSVYSPAVDTLSEDYGVGTEVTVLGISFTLAGFGLGPLLWFATILSSNRP